MPSEEEMEHQARFEPPENVELRGGLPMAEPEGSAQDLAALAHYVAELATTAVRPHVFRVFGDPDATWISDRAGLRRVPHVAPMAKLDFEALEDLAQALAGPAKHPLAVDPVVFLDERAARAHFDAKSRRDSAAVGLLMSPRWALFESMPEEAPKRVPAKDVPRFLRTMLGLDASSPVYAAFQRMRFLQNRATEVARVARVSSLGASVENAVEGASEIPDRFEVPAVLWSGVRWAPRVLVPVEVWVDHDTQSVDFFVRKVELAEARRQSMLAVQESFQEYLAGLEHEEGSDRPVPVVHLGSP